jgi:hypothetical protein
VPLHQFNAEGDEIETSYWLVDPQANPKAQYESKEREAAIQKSLHKLPSIYRIVLVVDVQGLSYEEAATASSVLIGTVKSRLARARLQMQKVLQTERKITQLKAKMLIQREKSAMLMLKESIVRMVQVGQFQQHVEHSHNICIPGSVWISMGKSCIEIRGECDNGSC